MGLLGTLHGADPNISHYIPDETIWPLLTTSDAEFCKWIGDILPEVPQNENMVCSDVTSYDLPISHLSTVSYEHQITEKNYENMPVTVSPKTPVPFLGRTSTTEIQQVEKSKQYITFSHDSTSASIMYCQPFSILKPEGGYSLQKINETLNKTSPQFGQSQTLGADYGPRSSFGRDPGASVSGKPILARTKIVTEGQGTLTILRTAN